MVILYILLGLLCIYYILAVCDLTSEYTQLETKREFLITLIPFYVWGKGIIKAYNDLN